MLSVQAPRWGNQWDWFYAEPKNGLAERGRWEEGQSKDSLYSRIIRDRQAKRVKNKIKYHIKLFLNIRGHVLNV